MATEEDPPVATAALLALLHDRSRWDAELTAATLAELLARGADVHARDSNGRTPLLLAVNAKTQGAPSARLEVIDRLLAAGSDPSAEDRYGDTVFAAAFAPRDASAQEHAASLAVLQRLGAAGANTKKQALYYSASMLDIWAYLLTLGAQRVDVPDASGSYLLHHAAHWAQPALCALFLERGAAVNALDALGGTPLHRALRQLRAPSDGCAGDDEAYARVAEVLTAAGGVERVPLEGSAGDARALRPIDPDALAAAAGDQLRGPWHAAVARRPVSAQELVAELVHDGTPSQAHKLLAALASTLGEPAPLRWEGALVVDAPFFWHGDLIVDGSVSITDRCAITGSLHVSGVVHESESVVTIGGALRCLGLYTSGDFAVGGPIEARDLVVGYYNDCVLSAEVIRTHVFLSDEHATSAKIEARHAFDATRYEQGHGEGVADELRALFIAELLDDEGQLDYALAFERLERGEAILREP
ncbi:MAG: ankyrin repeat domain-containing protein [Kofleriaceae bacterium]